MDLIDRQAAIDFIAAGHFCNPNEPRWSDNEVVNFLKSRPSAQPERLTDDDFETIRIHLSAYKERLCNQCRWKEAEEYQKIINRLMSFASAQPDIIVCADCKHWVCHDRRCGYWNHGVKPLMWCSQAERRTDDGE